MSEKIWEVDPDCSPITEIASSATAIQLIKVAETEVDDVCCVMRKSLASVDADFYNIFNLEETID